MSAALRLITFAPADTDSIIAAPSSSCVVICEESVLFRFSAKIVRKMKLQPGHMAGAGDPRLAASIPITNVPWIHASLVEF
jgi:hypothetical protein